MSDILISLLLLILFAGFWALMFKIGGLDWVVDARMASARRMLAGARYAFDGEVHARAAHTRYAASHAPAAPDAPVAVLAPRAATPAGWIPQALAHA